MCGISKQYTDDIVTYHFLIFSVVWFMTNVVLCIEKLQVFVLHNNNFRLTKTFDLLKLSRKINWCEVLVVNALLKLLGISEDMNYFKVWLRFPYSSVSRKRRFDTHRSLKYSFSSIPFRRSLICKNFFFCVFNFGSWIKFAKLDIFLKTKPDSMCQYEKLKLWHTCKIYLAVHDAIHEFDLLLR